MKNLLFQPCWLSPLRLCPLELEAPRRKYLGGGCSPENGKINTREKSTQRSWNFRFWFKHHILKYNFYCLPLSFERGKVKMAIFYLKVNIHARPKNVAQSVVLSFLSPGIDSDRFMRIDLNKKYKLNIHNRTLLSFSLSISPRLEQLWLVCILFLPLFSASLWKINFVRDKQQCEKGKNKSTLTLCMLKSPHSTARRISLKLDFWSLRSFFARYLLHSVDSFFSSWHNSPNPSPSKSLNRMQQITDATLNRNNLKKFSRMTRRSI